ncbi:MAG: hypothetical protein J7L66_04280 [Anaerolineaceae bacterium]|nr:hypothetical protein [Anaerolineaceae bacterium]
MKIQQVRKILQKGLVYAIIMIFIMMIGFHEIAAMLISKISGVDVLRGSSAEVQYMAYFIVLFGLWVGWAASGKSGKNINKVLNGFAVSVVAGIFIALFDLILVFLVETGTDIREYLTAFSIHSMSFFLLNLGKVGPSAHFGIIATAGLFGSVLVVFLHSETVQKARATAKTAFASSARSINDALPPFIWKFGKYALYLLLAAAMIILPTRWGSYLNFVAGLVGLYVIAGIGLNIIVGLSGQLVLGYAAFFAMGAYSVALLNSEVPHAIFLGFWPSLIIAILMAILAAVILGLPIMGLRGDYLAIVTLAFGEIIRILLKSDLLTAYTGGPRGIMDIQGPMFFGKPFYSDVDFIYIIFAGVALTIFLYNRLQDSRTGRAWLAIKEDAIAAKATGINLQKYKLLALCIGAAFAGLAGGISAARNQFTGPNEYSLQVSMNVLSIIIVGGINSIPGIILGAFALKGLPEILREVENYRQLAFGALLIVMMIMRPNGLWPSSRPFYEKYKNSKGKEEKYSDSGKEKKGKND